MAFEDFPGQTQGVQLLQRSLERGRLAHGYLFTGHQLEELEALAKTLAQTLNCQNPVRQGRAAVDCCGRCLACQKVARGNHADVHWVRPESKLRVITIDQMRDLMREIQLKPTEAEYKVAVVVAADRLHEKAANAFLKTLEEPPAKSILILLTTDPSRILETILSRCLRLNFAGDGPPPLDPAQLTWLASFSEMAGAEHKSLLGRYRLMDVLLRRLNEMKTATEETLTARSPLQHYPDAEEEQKERWEDELTAAVEAEYRRQRTDLLGILQWWLRDVWLRTLQAGNGAQESKLQTPNAKLQGPERASPPPPSAREPRTSTPETRGRGPAGLLSFPQLDDTRRVAERISSKDALENLQILEQLQRWLGTNVQEALALEVGLLKLRL
jgi:DNA polymerase III subunit delta'